MTFQYREFRDPDDIEGCLRLWAENSKWGPITKEDWYCWYRDTPHGPALVNLAIDKGGEVVGQVVFSPMLLQLQGQAVMGLRMSAPILSKSVRLQHLKHQDHPLVGLFASALRTASAKGYSFLYALPARGWLDIVRWARDEFGVQIDTGEYGCRELQAEQVRQGSENAELHCRQISSFSSEFLGLWNEACVHMPIQCAVARVPQLLTYRHGSHLNVEVRRGDRLIGYVCVREDSGLIDDFLACDPNEVEPVLRAALYHLAHQQNSASTPQQFKALDAPVLSPVLARLGFEEVRFRFAFVSISLNPSCAAEQTASDHWYLTAGD